jgi:GTPase SAR1 family protein
MHLTYIIGEPGTGKSSLVRRLTDGWAGMDSRMPFLHRRYENGVLVLGGDREGFPGTDMLALDAQPRVIALFHEQQPPFVLGEGDRLANDKFFMAAQSIGYDLHIYHLVGAGVARDRRAARGSQQDEAFIKGRRTKCAALAKTYGALDISPTMPPSFLVKLLQDPVSTRFKR